MSPAGAVTGRELGGPMLGRVTQPTSFPASAGSRVGRPAADLQQLRARRRRGHALHHYLGDFRRGVLDGALDRELDRHG